MEELWITWVKIRKKRNIKLVFYFFLQNIWTTFTLFFFFLSLLEILMCRNDLEGQCIWPSSIDVLMLLFVNCRSTETLDISHMVSRIAHASFYIYLSFCFSRKWKLNSSKYILASRYYSKLLCFFYFCSSLTVVQINFYITDFSTLYSLLLQ